MYIMYADESGDTGLNNSPSRHFVLSGLVVHESRWRDLLDHLLKFRRSMKTVYGLPLRTEIHASEYIRSPPVSGIEKYHRLAILRNMVDELGKLDYISITNVVIDKHTKTEGYDVFESAWRTLIQRFENTIQYGNFPGGHRSDKGLLFVDATDGEKLQKLTRKMTIYNPIPSKSDIGRGARNIPMVRVIEDAHHKNSAESHFIQVADVCAYFLQQKYSPSSYIRKKGATRYFDRLGQALNKKASSNNDLGIVFL